MGDLRSDCRALVARLPPGDPMRVHVERLCYQVDAMEGYWLDEVRGHDALRAKIRDVLARIADGASWRDARADLAEMVGLSPGPESPPAEQPPSVA